MHNLSYKHFNIFCLIMVCLSRYETSISDAVNYTYASWISFNITEKMDFQNIYGISNKSDTAEQTIV